MVGEERVVASEQSQEGRESCPTERGASERPKAGLDVAGVRTSLEGSGQRDWSL